MTQRQIKILDLTLPEPAANLALDEALLEGGHSVLRFWEPGQYFVVIGYSNHIAREVNLEECRRAGVPVYRRCSGGGTVLQGPGCLNYSLILPLDETFPVQTITDANCFIMSRQRDALASISREEAVQIQGHTDLVLGNLKFSGNAQRRQRHALLFHGTFLLNFNLALVQQFLPMPSVQPAYRQGRSHDQFLTNFPSLANTVKTALRKIWAADIPLEVVPDHARLMNEKYSRDEWNFKF